MNSRLLCIAILPILLVACTPQPGGNSMMHGNGMMQNGGMMNGNQAETGGFMPGQGKDVTSLPEAQSTQTIDVQDGQTITLNPTLVRKTVNGKEIAMYGYNGQIPGPLLRVKQGSTFMVNVTNGKYPFLKTHC